MHGNYISMHVAPVPSFWILPSLCVSVLMPLWQLISRCTYPLLGIGKNIIFPFSFKENHHTWKNVLGLLLVSHLVSFLYFITLLSYLLSLSYIYFGCCLIPLVISSLARTFRIYFVVVLWEFMVYVNRVFLKVTSVYCGVIYRRINLMLPLYD